MDVQYQRCTCGNGTAVLLVLKNGAWPTDVLTYGKPQQPKFSRCFGWVAKFSKVWGYLRSPTEGCPLPECDLKWNFECNANVSSVCSAF